MRFVLAVVALLSPGCVPAEVKPTIEPPPRFKLEPIVAPIADSGGDAFSRATQAALVLGLEPSAPASGVLRAQVTYVDTEATKAFEQARKEVTAALNKNRARRMRRSADPKERLWVTPGSQCVRSLRIDVAAGFRSVTFFPTAEVCMQLGANRFDCSTSGFSKEDVELVWRFIRAVAPQGVHIATKDAGSIEQLDEPQRGL